MPTLQKYRLFAPGPTPVPDEVRAALAEPVVHHRTAAFETIFAEVREHLRWVFQTAHEVLCLSGTGTAAMDGAVCNMLCRGDTALYVNAGKFGERWGEILRAYGVHAVEVPVPWGQAVAADAVAKALAAHPNARAVYVQACETSTGVIHPVRDIAALCAARPDTLCIVDGITAVGVMDLALDRDRIDVLISGSQKAFMLPPGLAFVAVGPRAWKAAERADLPRYYLNFLTERQAASKNQSAWTSSVSLICGLRASLRLLRAEGLPAVFARHERLAAACRAGFVGMGCSIFARTPAPGVTAVMPPAGIAAEQVVKKLADDYNLTIVGGQDTVKNKIFRVAHMGYFDATDMLTLVATVEMALQDLGHRAHPGAAIAAAQREFAA